MRLESCNHFDTERFIKNLKNWKKEKEKLKKELEEMPMLPSVKNDSGVHSTDVSDPTSRLALKRLEIIDEIEDIEQCERAYEIAKGHLTPHELEIFKIFFEPKEPIWKGIDRYAHGNYTCRMNIYRERRKILEKLDRLIANNEDLW